jgi:hypothetical protein
MSKSDKEAIAKAPERRVKRTPLGTRNVLTIAGKEPGFHYRFVNDTGDRVQEFLDMGYELVEQKDVRIGDKRLGAPSTEGSVAKASVGRGTQAYVMRIKQDWYEEDQKAKQEYVDQTEAATKEKALDGTYGDLKITRS